MLKKDFEKQTIDCAYVVIKKFPFDTPSREVLPESRAHEIANCQSNKVKDSKFYAWKLLEEVVAEKFDRKISDAYFDKSIGKWKMENLHFSISHSQDVVSIAVSYSPIGVDIELINEERFSTLRKEKILSDEELNKSLSSKDLCVIWSQKEALFKSLDKRCFIPREINVESGVQSQILSIDDREFVLSVAGITDSICISNQCEK